MIRNYELLKKRRIEKMVSLPNISLEAQDADKFLDYIVDESALMHHARIVRMNKETINIRALGLGDTRFLYDGDEFSSENYKTQFTQNKISMTSKKARGAVAIHDDDLEDNPEGNAFVTHILQMIAKTVATELEEVYWIADTQSVGGFSAPDLRQTLDGWRYRITTADSTVGANYNSVAGVSYTLDATSGTFDLAGDIVEQDTSPPYDSEFKFQKMITTMPTKYRRDRKALRFFCNQILIDDYAESLQNRGTSVGDKSITDDWVPNYRGIPLVAVNGFPLVMNGDVYTGGAHTDCLLTPMNNLIIGLQRDIKIETSREAADESTYFFYTMRTDCQIENPNACVLLEKITHSG